MVEYSKFLDEGVDKSGGGGGEGEIIAFKIKNLNKKICLH